MNIVIPDSWLREFLSTKANPQQIKECLSLCGPSVERIRMVGNEPVYDIEITGNRPDAMSVFGIAREAAAILPRFGIKAFLVGDPYAIDTAKSLLSLSINHHKKLMISTDGMVNPRFTAIIIEDITIAPSPLWLSQRLEKTGIRSINNVVDSTNYIMKMYGQPVHAFDFDKIRPENDTGVMKVRASKKGEKLTTLDGKVHTLPGDDIVIEDSSGRLIDLCGIMGCVNSGISDKTRTIILFVQTYNPINIRRTSMKLAQRTEAAALFEKSLDPELVLPSIFTGIDILVKLTRGRIASKLYDMYPNPNKPRSVAITKEKVSSYLGTVVSDKEIHAILQSLGFHIKITAHEIIAVIPSYRQDVTCDVDIIEEIARIYGYHNITPKLPDTEPPQMIQTPILTWEEEIKIRLRDWGYTELYTYSMISEELMDTFGLDKTKAYKIMNPLSDEWVYMRPHLLPGVLYAICQNVRSKKSFRVFELSMEYHYRKDDLPLEAPTLAVVWAGNTFIEAKGLAETIFQLFGIPFPSQSGRGDNQALRVYGEKQFFLGNFGSFGEIHPALLAKVEIHTAVTCLLLHFSTLVSHANQIKKYTPIPKFPPSFEDLAFVLPDKTEIGPMMETIRRIDPIISNIELLDSFQQTRTFHVTYQDQTGNLTSDDIRQVREKIVVFVKEKFHAEIKEA